MADVNRFISTQPTNAGITLPGGGQLRASTPSQYMSPGVTQPQMGKYTRQQQTGPGTFAGLAVADFLNTVSSSVGLTDDTLLGEQLKQRMPDTYRYYLDNKGAIQFTASVVGAFIPGTLGIKALSAMSKAGTALSKIPGASRLVAYEKKIKSAEAALATRSGQLADQGIAGAAYKLDTEYQKLAKARLIYGVQKGLTETAASELAVIGTMNSSEILFPEEWSWYDHLPFLALGAGAGAGIEALIAKKATSSLIRQQLATAHVALNPNDLPDQIITRPGVEDVGTTLLALNNRDMDLEIAARGTGTTSDYIAQTSRKKQVNTGQILGTDTKKGLLDSVAYRGIPEFAPRTELSKGQKINLELAISENPLSILGVKEIMPYDAETTSLVKLTEDKKNYVAKLQKDSDALETRANSKKVSRAEKAAKLEESTKLRERARNIEQKYNPYVLRDGQWIPLEDHFVLFTDFPKNRREFETKVPFDLSGRQIKGAFDPLTKEEFSFGIDYSFDYAGTKGKSLANLHTASVYEQSAVFAGFDAVIDGIKNIRIDKTAKLPRVQVTSKDNWRRLDAIDEGIRRGHLDPKSMTFSQDMPDLPAMRMEIVNQKFKEFRQFREKNTSQMQSLIKKKTAPVSDASIRYSLNIPAAQFGEVSPLELLFHAFIDQGTTDLKGMSFSELINQAVMLKHFGDPDLRFAEKTINELQAQDYNPLLRGNSFGPPEKMRKSGQYLEPVLAWRQELSPQELTLQSIDNSMLIRRQDVKNTLLQSAYDPALSSVVAAQDTMSGKIAGMLEGNPIAQTAAAVDQISQASLRGNAVFTTSRFASRDDPVMQAAHEVNTIVDRVKNRHIIDTLNQTGSHGKQYVQTFNILRNKENEAHLIQFGEFLRARQAGWFLNAKPMANADGTFSYVLLKDSEFNQKRYRALFGEELKDDTAMPRITTDDVYRPLKVSPLAHDAAVSMSEMGGRLLGDQNRIRKGMAKNPIRHKEWWAPPRVFTGKHVAYIVNRTEEGVIKRIITGDTAAELSAIKASDEIQEYTKSVGGVIYDQDAVVKELGQSGFNNARDKVFFELLDAGDPLVKGTKASKGSSVDPVFGRHLERMNEAIESMNRQWENIARDTVGLWFEPQIAWAARADFIHPTNKVKTASGQVRDKELSAWKYYADTLLGNRLLRRDTTIGGFYNFVESHVDVALERYWDATKGKGITGLIAGTAQKNLAKVGFEPSKKRFERLKSELGEWLPYENTSEFLESNFNIKPPKSAREFAAELNALTSALTLRMFELAHPVLNISGIVATSPAVISALRMRADENLAGWQGRVSAYGSVVPSTKPFSFFNSVRLMTNAATFGFKSAGKAELAYAKKYGYLDQQVAELNEIISNPLRSEGDWKDWAHKSVDVVSTLSDKSEIISRGWAHMAGILLAKDHGITDQKLRHVFAHRFANELIGDYRSSNRPVVFQGAAGMPLGLFQTYMWNYYQRLYSYIENRDIRSIATQYAMQASVFGAQTMPGYQLFNSMWSATNENRDTPTDKVQANFGSDVADVLLYGTLSSIPKIFGGDGIALYTRGDTSPRVPTFIDPSQAPIAQFGKNFFQMLAGVANQLQTGGQGLSAQQTSEVFSQFFINRPMARMMELYAGYATDRSGNVVSDDVYNMTSIIARTMGLRPLNEAKTMEILHRQKITDAAQYAIRGRLREAIKSAARGDGLNEDLLAGAFEDYAVSGGDPKYFTRFLKTTIMAATTPKGQIAVDKMLRSNTKIQDAIRLLNSGVIVDDIDGVSQ